MQEPRLLGAGLDPGNAIQPLDPASKIPKIVLDTPNSAKIVRSRYERSRDRQRYREDTMLENAMFRRTSNGEACVAAMVTVG